MPDNKATREGGDGGGSYTNNTESGCVEVRELGLCSCGGGGGGLGLTCEMASPRKGEDARRRVTSTMTTEPGGLTVRKELVSGTDGGERAALVELRKIASLDVLHKVNFPPFLMWGPRLRLVFPRSHVVKVRAFDLSPQIDTPTDPPSLSVDIK